jgi:hypothetical protein
LAEIECLLAVDEEAHVRAHSILLVDDAELDAGIAIVGTAMSPIG